MKKILFIMRSMPHSGVQIQETLDVILTAAAFEQQVALLFLDDGIFQLKRGQQPHKHSLKDTASIFYALEIYDVKEFYTEIESIQERGLTIGDLSLAVQPLNRNDINTLMQQYDVIMSG